MLSEPLWCCGSPPLVVAALAGCPSLVLTLLHHGAGHHHHHHHHHHQQHKRINMNGVYQAVIFLIRKLLDEWRGSEEGSSAPPAPDLLTWAGNSPTAKCLRYLLRTITRVPHKLLRDQLNYSDPASLLPPRCCRDPPPLLHLARVAVRELLRVGGELPGSINTLDLPAPLRCRLSLLRD
ncbi:hypothetical protein O3P69_018870 [Scylla paramamosain]|uniref:SOCS box domain-containing protein n=1 Tax=Scylla paramamosain TaxID=85552 RepID=A0AAW0SS92_SCYPA